MARLAAVIVALCLLVLPALLCGRQSLIALLVLPAFVGGRQSLSTAATSFSVTVATPTSTTAASSVTVATPTSTAATSTSIAVATSVEGSLYSAFNTRIAGFGGAKYAPWCSSAQRCKCAFACCAKAVLLRCFNSSIGGAAYTLWSSVAQYCICVFACWAEAVR